jgi:hypothetical protein
VLGELQIVRGQLLEGQADLSRAGPRSRTLTAERLQAPPGKGLVEGEPDALVYVSRARQVHGQAQPVFVVGQVVDRVAGDEDADARQPLRRRWWPEDVRGQDDRDHPDDRKHAEGVDETHRAI